MILGLIKLLLVSLNKAKGGTRKKRRWLEMTKAEEEKETESEENSKTLMSTMISLILNSG